MNHGIHSGITGTYPELIQDSTTHLALNLLLTQKSLEVKYKPFIDATKHKYNGKYIPNIGEERGYIDPVNPYQ